MDADPLPRCPHGNEAVVRANWSLGTAPGFAWIDADGPCPCTVQADTFDRARRAWVALCDQQPTKETP